MTQKNEAKLKNDKKRQEFKMLEKKKLDQKIVDFKKKLEDSEDLNDNL